MRLINKSFLATAVIALAAALCVSAQDSRPRFEVASIKRNTSGQGSGVPFAMLGGRFVANNTNLETLIRWSYRSSDGKRFLHGEIMGVPGWATTDRFDIQATAEGDNATVPLQDVKAMAETMLQDRFQLKSHRETREMPICALVVVRPSRIKLSEDQSPPGPPPPFTGQPVTGPSPRGVIGFGPSSLSARAIPLSMLTDFLSGFLNKRVYDRTGVSGLVDIKMQWTPDTELAPDTTATSVAPTQARPQFFGPSFIGALPEQLGLKLESARGPVEVLVIDSVSKPSEN